MNLESSLAIAKTMKRPIIHVNEIIFLVVMMSLLCYRS